MAARDALDKIYGVDLRQLKPLQRILLITDGTLTEILEAYFLEHIRLEKLSQEIVEASSAHRTLIPGAGEKLLERKIILRGADSGTAHVYAESAIAFERLPSALRDGLLRSDTPLGRLWLEHRLETFKELVDIRSRPAHELAAHFGCRTSDPLLARTYRVITDGKPAMIISEFFCAE